MPKTGIRSDTGKTSNLARASKHPSLIRGKGGEGKAEFHREKKRFDSQLIWFNPIDLSYKLLTGFKTGYGSN